MFAATAEFPLSEIRFWNPIRVRREFFRAADVTPESPTAQFTAQLSDLSALAKPLPIPAGWLPVIQKRIQDSVFPSATEYANDGSWLSLEVANRAVRFFEATSDMLPAEPYIYSSQQGDLITEFQTREGRLTIIIGAKFVFAFAVVRGVTLKEELHTTMDSIITERRILQRLARKLPTNQNGAVESTK